MAKKEVVMINRLERTYNGIGKNQTITVEPEQVEEYISYGFELMYKTMSEPEEKTVEPESKK